MKSLPKPLNYPHQPIRSLEALSAALQVPLDQLKHLATTADSRYRKAKAIVKPDGSIRQPWDANPELKRVHRRIKDRLLVHVEFPDSLTGSLKGKDARRNATLHEGAAIAICEDIEKFFPNTKSALVYSAWLSFFGFSKDVAEILTLLTTKEGALPEGAITSSYLANLAFWNKEPALESLFLDMGVTYSRYVDDISVSSKTPLDKQQLTRCIALIYGMIAACGLRAKRRKHEITRGHGQMRVTKLLVNKRASLPSAERLAIRAAVFQLEQKVTAGVPSKDLIRELNSVSGRVSRLNQMHQREASVLRQRLTTVREKMR